MSPAGLFFWFLSIFGVYVSVEVKFLAARNSSSIGLALAKSQRFDDRLFLGVTALAIISDQKIRFFLENRHA